MTSKRTFNIDKRQIRICNNRNYRMPTDQFNYFKKSGLLSRDIQGEKRIASPEMLPANLPLPHLNCSRHWPGGNDAEGEHGDAQGID